MPLQTRLFGIVKDKNFWYNPSILLLNKGQSLSTKQSTLVKETPAKSDNLTIIFQLYLIDFKGMSTHIVLFYA